MKFKIWNLLFPTRSQCHNLPAHNFDSCLSELWGSLMWEGKERKKGGNSGRNHKKSAKHSPLSTKFSWEVDVPTFYEPPQSLTPNYYWFWIDESVMNHHPLRDSQRRLWTRRHWHGVQQRVGPQPRSNWAFIDYAVLYVRPHLPRAPCNDGYLSAAWSMRRATADGWSCIKGGAPWRHRTSLRRCQYVRCPGVSPTVQLFNNCCSTATVGDTTPLSVCILYCSITHSSTVQQLLWMGILRRFQYICCTVASPTGQLFNSYCFTVSVGDTVQHTYWQGPSEVQVALWQYAFQS